MDFIKEIKKIIGDKRDFTFDIRHHEDTVTIIVIIKDSIEGISFEPFIVNGEIKGMEDVFTASLQAHYDMLKPDLEDVEKFLGAKTIKQATTIKKEVDAIKHPEELDSESFDLEF